MTAADQPVHPAIFRLSPELLAIIFHHVYVTPVVHRPTTSAITSATAATAPPSEALQVSYQGEGMTSDVDNTNVPSSSSSSLSISSTLISSRPMEAGTMTSAAPSFSSPAMTVAPGLTPARRRREKRKSTAAAVYIQNDLSSMLALCLTCRAFYPQAIRILWRQRTLAGYDDLTEFYQAIEFSASQRKRHQKQRQQEQQEFHLPQQPRQRPIQMQSLNIGYAVEEELFNNEAALRIKSLTLLEIDKFCGASSSATVATSGEPSALPAVVSGGSALGTDSVTALSNQFFGSSSISHSDGHYNPGGSTARLDLCQGIDCLQKTINQGADEAMTWTAYRKDDGTAVSSSSSSSASSSRRSRSYGRSRSMSQSKRRSRQKTSSIYSQMLSPRLLSTIANHCFALVDLTIGMDKRTSLTNANRISAPYSSSLQPQQQPTVPFSILAGSVLSLKRLTLMGLICDPQQNRTGTELLMFAKNIQPLERISIRSCQGISLETFVEFAARSHHRLLSIDFQGLDFESSQELTDAVSAYAYHCRNMSSITLSCKNALVLDGVMNTLAKHQALELRELHVLGHDTVRTAAVAQQQAQLHNPAPAPGAPQEQQQQQPDENNNNIQNGTQVPVTQMCQLSDATLALSSLAQIRLRRLTLYCPGITDYALFLYLCRSSQLSDLVLSEPTTMLHHPQFQSFIEHHHTSVPPNSSDSEQSEQSVHESSPVTATIPALAELEETVAAVDLAPFTSAVFLDLILRRCPWLNYMFMKLTLETAQEWIAQPCFREAGLDKCLYQYRTATGAPAVVLMWDIRKKTIANTKA
ncbi:hypothetical protein BGX28_005515 [Mortierella sp. GBA30]|nr:hypothetical protein BGX28_005515 [Mortierella sp. GBA30]